MIFESVIFNRYAIPLSKLSKSLPFIGDFEADTLSVSKASEELEPNPSSSEELNPCCNDEPMRQAKVEVNHVLKPVTPRITLAETQR